MHRQNLQPTSATCANRTARVLHGYTFVCQMWKNTYICHPTIQAIAHETRKNWKSLYVRLHSNTIYIYMLYQNYVMLPIQCYGFSLGDIKKIKTYLMKFSKRLRFKFIIFFLDFIQIQTVEPIEPKSLPFF